jgi:hypothetical protein
MVWERRGVIGTKELNVFWHAFPFRGEIVVAVIRN